jgi:hypothetical protein
VEFRYAIGGTSRKMGLGVYPDVTLKETRMGHAEQRKVFISGKDPLENKRMLEWHRIAREAMKFSYVANLLIDAREPAWTSSKNEPQWRSSLETYAYSILDANQRSNLVDKRRAMMKDNAKFATSAMQQQRMIAR